MEESITILVENYNISESKYEFGKQVLTAVKIPLLKKILKELPFGKDALIPPRIITYKIIISKREDDLYYFNFNFTSSYFLSNRDNRYSNKKSHEFKLEELEDLLKPPEKSKYKKIFAVFQAVVGRVWFLNVILNIIFFISFLIQELDKRDANIIFITFLIWLNIFCAYSLIFGITKIIKLKDEPQKIKLEYSIPFITVFETVDVSETIIVIGQFFLYGFAIIYQRNITVSHIIGLILIGIVLGSLLIIFTINYKFSRMSKFLYLHMLYNILHNHLEGNEKQFCFQITLALKEKPLLSSEKIPKFFTLFSVLLTFIPIITYLFVYG